jgi:PhnB protein
MASPVRPIPEGYSTLTPHLIIKNAGAAIDFYKKAFGATELFRMPGPGGCVMHAEMKIGNSVMMMADEFPDMGCKGPASLGGSCVTLHIYVEDVDSFYNKAIEAGATVRMPISDMPWGDRYGQFTDPFGHTWSVATHKEDVSAEECARRMAEFCGGGQQQAA